jgi:NagD protein
VTPADVRERLRDAEGFVFDLDGTLALSDRHSHGYKALPGSLDLLALLRERAKPFVILTNGTVHTPAAYTEMLERAGIEIDERDMLTPAVVAAQVLVAKGYRRVLVLGGTGVAQPLADAGLITVLPRDADRSADAVFVGWHADFVFPDLEVACEAVWSGAPVYSASDAPFFATSAGRTIGISRAICASIHSVTGRRSRVVGKPSASALRVCAARLGRTPRHIAVVGDDPVLEMRMALAGGALAVGVCTGLTDEAGFESQPLDRRAHATFPSVRELLGVLREAG